MADALDLVLRNARVVQPRTEPRLVVCWGGHAISRAEYDYTKDVGYALLGRIIANVSGMPYDRYIREQIMLPLDHLTLAESQARIAAAQQPYVIVVVPLLLETGAYRELIQRVLVVDCDESQQIERTVKRSGLTADDVRAIMAAQLPRAQRLMAADDVLRNSGDLPALHRQAEALHAKYLTLAHGDAGKAPAQWSDAH